MSDAIQSEAQERRDGHRTLSLQIEEVRGEVGAVKAEVGKVAIGLRRLKRRSSREVAALTEELAKLNRRALAIAFAAVLASLGSLPEARAILAQLVKSMVGV